MTRRCIPTLPAATAVWLSCAPCDGTRVEIRDDDGATSLQACVDVARTAEERRRGLAGEPDLPEGGGMLFEFPVTGEVCMTGAGMLFPITVAFVDEDLSIIAVSPLSPGGAPICERPARYALELSRSAEGKLEVGDHLVFVD